VKILDKYILKSFIQPFIATFFIVLFVLVMQALWLAFDEIAGKGIDIWFILKFLVYLSLTVVPMALPIAILLSSIMALGALSEHYEFAAIKSAGISLYRLIRPLVILTIFISGLNFFFLNNVYPWATFKQKNLYLNIKKKKPALALIPGTFNADIPNYSIYFKEKYGEEENLLRGIKISDLSKRKGNVTRITAEKGKITTEEGSKYLTFTLENGYFYEEDLGNRNMKQRKRALHSKAKFDKHIINIDISSFSLNDLDSTKIKQHYTMLSLNQLDSIGGTKKTAYDDYVSAKAKNYFLRSNGNKLYKYHDTLVDKGISMPILDNFKMHNQIIVLDNAIQSIERNQDLLKNHKNTFKSKRKGLNLYDFEFYNRIAFSLACLVLFFIGAPLGAIIRKGGFGLPMIAAIVIFVIYFFITQFGKNLAEESAISALTGSWISTVILLPIGFFLTRRASKGMGIINISSFFDKIKSFFTIFKNTKQQRN